MNTNIATLYGSTIAREPIRKYSHLKLLDLRNTFYFVLRLKQLHTGKIREHNN